MAPTTIERAGKRVVPATRETVTTPSSSGSRSASIDSFGRSLHHHKGCLGGDELANHVLSGGSRARENDVVVELVDTTLHASHLQNTAEVALHHHRCEHRHEVEHRACAEKNQANGPLTAPLNQLKVGEHLAVAHR